MKLIVHEVRHQEPLLTDPYDRWLAPTGECVCEFHRTLSEFVLRFPDQVDFLVNLQASSVQAWPASGGSVEIARKLFENSILPLIGNHDGGLFLHGSAVRAQSGAIGFLGYSRSGKTTLAGAFAKAGWPYMSEDVVDLQSTDEGFLLRPKRSALRLFKDSASHLLGLALDGVQGDGKQSVDSSDAIPFSDKPARLAALFILGEDHEAALSIEPLHASAALPLLMKHCFVLDVEDRGRLKSHFGRLADLADKVPVFQLHYPREYPILPEVCNAVARIEQGLDRDEAE
ncbi:hypothetical protein [Erythrobacter sp. F6033]|uniref:hypothetical protein n=1 Tax=Erythrobacter sp. F6033 TaxID=2926401 RepID=UPI001FF6ACEC|nr:hypothetical protein [Erythrobacter sp. F6033]MCK0127180.1 hypothetical protein [Erythrobacter sp. F6033]